MSLSSMLNPDDENAYAIENSSFDTLGLTFSDDLLLDTHSAQDWLAGFPEYVTDASLNNIHPLPQGAVGDAVGEIQFGLESWARAVAEPPGENVEAQSVANDEDYSFELNENTEMVETTHNAVSNELEFTIGRSNDNDWVCYGMIHRVEAKLVGHMKALLDQLTPPEGASPFHLQKFILQNRTDHALLVLPSGSDFGNLRDNVSRALLSIPQRDEIELEPVAPSNELCRKIDSATKATDAIVHVDINVYGPFSRASNVGGVLSSHKIWLQRPDYCRKEYRYENPHVIQFPDVENLMQSKDRGPAVSSAKRRIGDEVLQLVSEVEQSTNRADGLERAQGDARLQTQLLEHQERALSFMLQRESGDVPEEFRLWKLTTIGEEKRFVHQITKTRCPVRPDEKGGGILADEMGMGKSLSVLALVLKTIEEGHLWAEKSRLDEHAHSRIRHHTRSTLVIVPAGLLINNWLKEVEMHVGDAIKVIRYHGHARERDPETLARSDIVLTTYKTLATDVSLKNSPLHSISWFRIVLDEAHNIRRTATTFHRSCADLHARSRWCLTGTPIQNGLEDIGALFVFLRAKPFHSMAKFRRLLVVPFEQREPIAKERLTMLYDSLVLRRTKDILDLPGQEERVRELELSVDERNQYNRTRDILARFIRQKVGEHEDLSNFGLFQSHMQLRILCNHGTHQKVFSWKRRSIMDEKEAVLVEFGLNAEKKCAVCLESRPIIDSNSARNSFLENCAHIICASCMGDDSNCQGGDSLRRHCPMCRAVGKSRPDGPIGGDHLGRMTDVAMSNGGEESFADSYFNTEGCSTKMEALVKDVKEALEESVRGDDGKIRKTKSIIFSCWTRTLNLIQSYLRKNSIDFVRIDGDCLVSKRQRILDQFSGKGGPRVMLMTTGTGAFGLNLTAANRIFIVELQWNPSVEKQAIARAIRIRQKDKVIVTRYIVVDTVEQEMKSQQVNKRRAAQVGFVKTSD